MPSSGNPAITCTALSLVTDAYRKARVLALGQSLTNTSAEYTEIQPRLNFIIANAASRGLPLWAYERLAVPMVANQLAYSIGPGADVDTKRPLRVVEGSFIRQTTPGSDPTDTPLRLISRLEYEQYGAKFAQGIPNSIYYDAKITYLADPLKSSPSAGYGTLYVYTPLQTGVTRTVYLNVQRQLFAISDGTTGAAEEFDFPQEWYYYLVYAVAAEVADDNEAPEQRVMRLEKRRDDLLEGLLDWSVETASTTFAPQAMFNRG